MQRLVRARVTSVLGCGDVIVDERRMRATRRGDEMYVECLDTQTVHTLVCRLAEWVGHFNCTTRPDTGSHHQA